MIFGRVISCHPFFFFAFVVYECIMMSYRSSLHFAPVQWFLEYFRHDIHIYDISIFQTWHQHFFYFTWHLHLWQQCFSDMTATFITSLFFRHDIYIYDISVFVRHDIYIYDISVFFTWHLHSWHQCISDMWATFMTPVLFRHDIYIDDISVFF